MKDKSPVSGSRGAGLFPVDGIPDPVEATFDLPVAPDEVQDVPGRGLWGGEAGDPQSGFCAGFSGLLAPDHPIDSEDRLEVREVGVSCKLGEDSNGLNFDPVMSGEGGLMGRGKKPRCRGGRSHL